MSNKKPHPATKEKEAHLSGFHQDPTLSTCQEQLHRKRSHHGCVLVNNSNNNTQPQLLVAGGYETTNTSSVLRSVELYTNNQQWDKRAWPKLSNHRAAHAMAAVGGSRVYVLGGKSGNECFTSVECLDMSTTGSSSTTTTEWITLDTTLSSGRYAMASVAVGTDIYLVGGANQAGVALATVEVFDTVRNQIRSVTRLQTPRYGAAAAFVEDTLYVVGGCDSQGHVLDSIECLTVGANSKKKKKMATPEWKTCPMKLSKPRLYPAVAVVSQCLLVLGGQTSSSSSSENCNNQGALTCMDMVDTKRVVQKEVQALRSTSKTGFRQLLGLHKKKPSPPKQPTDSTSDSLVLLRSYLKELQKQGHSSSGRDDTYDSDNDDDENPSGNNEMDRYFKGGLPSFDNGRIVAKRELKASGQARVFRGTLQRSKDDEPPQTVAIKVFHSREDWDDCKHELVTLIKISGHANVMDVLDFFERPMPAFVMRFVSGGDLRDYLNKKGRMHAKKAVPLLTGIGEGLQHLHANGIVHRDLKSLNVLLEKAKGGALRPVLIDLGLGRSVRGSAPEGAQFQTRGVQGTPGWMAPEMGSAKKWSTKTDIYALGVVMWEIFTGALPFPGEPFEKVLRFVIYEKGRPDKGEMAKVRVPVKYQELIARLWHQDPAKRPSAGDFLKLLERAQNE